MWCEKCQRGIHRPTSVLGKSCPVCLEKDDKQPGILMTSEEAGIKHLKEAESIKSVRKLTENRGYETNEEIKNEVRAEFQVENEKLRDELSEIKVMLKERISKESIPIVKTENINIGSESPKDSASSGTPKTLKQGGKNVSK